MPLVEFSMPEEEPTLIDFHTETFVFDSTDSALQEKVKSFKLLYGAPLTEVHWKDTNSDLTYTVLSTHALSDHDVELLIERHIVEQTS